MLRPRAWRLLSMLQQKGTGASAGASTEAAAASLKAPSAPAVNTAPQAGFAPGAPTQGTSSSAASGSSGNSASGGGGGGGGGTKLLLASAALGAGAYYGYQHGYIGPLGHAAPPAKPAAGDAILSHTDSDDFKLHEPPAVAAAAASPGDPAGEGAAAGGDQYSAAADEFPGLVTIEELGRMAAPGYAPVGGLQGVSIDAAPIDDLLKEVYAASSPGPGPAMAADEPRPAGAWEEEEKGAAARIAAAMDAAAAAAAAAGEAIGWQDPGQRGGGGAGAGAAGGAAGGKWIPPEEQDLSPNGLLEAAAAAGYGPKDDWMAAAAQERQATADSKLMESLIKGLLDGQRLLEAQVEEERRHREAIKQEAEWQVSAITSKFQSLIEQQRRASEDMKALSVRAAEEKVAVDAARHQVAERLERSKALDKMREKVNTLSVAFSRRSTEAKVGSEAHRTALGALALANALEEGRPLGKDLAVLEERCQADVVVAAVVGSLPPSAMEKGLPTRAQLEERFDKVARAAKQLGYFPPGSGGVLAHAVAKVAVAAKVDTPTVGSGAHARIAQAREHLRAGRLLAAADALAAAAAGTEADAVVAGWVADARSRALADQNARLLQAHATSTAAALA